MLANQASKDNRLGAQNHLVSCLPGSCLPGSCRLLFRIARYTLVWFIDFLSLFERHGGR